jgi:formylglycine-generating enzyme required for sulfatase activity
MLRTLLLSLFALTFLAAPAWAQDQTAREFTECTDCPTMVGIPAGAFVMGSAAAEPGHFDNEGPQHRVAIKAFAIGKYPVTTEQFLKFLRDSGYKPDACNSMLGTVWETPGDGRAYPPFDIQPPQWPAVCLDWKDAQAYIAWLNAKVRAARPGMVKGSGPYRLPSEAEWEYAARGGTTTVRWWGDDIGVANANCNGCGSKADGRVLTDVDSFKPNPFGLYGVLGNAWQWTADCWHASYVGAPGDGRAWKDPSCTKHVIRGGSWDNTPIFVRSAARSGAPATPGEYDYSSLSGFRVARDLP